VQANQSKPVSVNLKGKDSYKRCMECKIQLFKDMSHFSITLGGGSTKLRSKLIALEKYKLNVKKAYVITCRI